MKVTGIVSGDPSRGFGQPGGKTILLGHVSVFVFLPACFRASLTFFNNTPSFEISFQTTVL